VERLHEDPGVADLGKRPTSISEAGIFAAIALLTNYWPDQAEHGSDLLERLAHLVDDLVPRSLCRRGQLLHDGVHPFPHHPPQALAEGLLGAQLKGHSVPPDASAGGPTCCGPPALLFLDPASRLPGTMVYNAGAAGRSLDELLAKVGPVPGERLELPP